MSDIRVDNIKNEAGTGSPGFPYGANITGIVTATSFSGNISAASITSGTIAAGRIPTLNQNTTGSAASATVASGLTGSPNISVGTITASGSVSIGGTLTYEDVTNIDSVGIVTARNGVDFKGVLREKVKITAGKLSDNTQINLDDGMVHFFTTQETATSIPNITSSVGINTIMAVGDTITLSVITTAAAGAYSANWTVDSVAVTEAWNGGAAPAAGGAAGKDFYTLNLIKTGNAAFTVLGNVSNFA